MKKENVHIKTKNETPIAEYISLILIYVLKLNLKGKTMRLLMTE